MEPTTKYCITNYHNYLLRGGKNSSLRDTKIREATLHDLLSSFFPVFVTENIYNFKKLRDSACLSTVET